MTRGMLLCALLAGCAVEAPPAKDALAPIEPSLFEDRATDGPTGLVDFGPIEGSASITLNDGTRYAGYRFSVPPRHRFTLDARGAEGFVDPVLFLYAQNDRDEVDFMIASNDDANGGVDSQISLTSEGPLGYMAVVSLRGLHEGRSAEGTVDLSLTIKAELGQACNDQPGGMRCIEGGTCQYPSGTRAECGVREDGTCISSSRYYRGCKGQYRPVCGCDGRDYFNVCDARVAGTDAAFTGACMP